MERVYIEVEMMEFQREEKHNNGLLRGEEK